MHNNIKYHNNTRQPTKTILELLEKRGLAAGAKSRSLQSEIGRLKESHSNIVVRELKYLDEQILFWENERIMALHAIIYLKYSGMRCSRWYLNYHGKKNQSDQ